MKRMKKLFSVLCAVLLCAALVSPACAAGQLTVSAGTATAAAGSEVSIPITITNNPGIAMADLKLQYDSSALTFVSAENGTVFQASELTESSATANPYPILFVSTAGNRTGDGTLITLHFQVKEGCKAGIYPLSFQGKSMLSNFNETVLTASFSAGAVTVEGASTVTEIVSVSLSGTTASAKVVCPDADAKVICAAYGKSGMMLGVQLKPVTAGESVYTFSFRTAERVKVFVVNENGHPLCAAKAG